MASLIKNGAYYGLIWTDSSREKEQVRETLKTSDYATAKRRKARLENAYWEGKHDPWERKWYEKPKQISRSIPRLIEQFIRYKASAKGRGGWNEATAEKEAYVMRKFGRLLGSKPISDLTEKDLQNLYYRDGVSSDHTRNSDYISMNTFLNWCIDRGHLKDKPVFRPQKPQTKLPKFLYPSQLKVLVDYQMKDLEERGGQTGKGVSYWVPLGWMMLAGTGIRPGELASLKVSHVKGDHIVVGEDFITKDRQERIVPLLYEAAPAAYLLTNKSFRKAEPYMCDSPYLLGLKPSHVKRKLSEEFSAAWRHVFPDQPRRTLYNLKDLYAVRFAYGGGNIDELRNILGHASLETTQRYLKAVRYGTKIEGSMWD